MQRHSDTRLSLRKLRFAAAVSSRADGSDHGVGYGMAASDDLFSFVEASLAEMSEHPGVGWTVDSVAGALSRRQAFLVELSDGYVIVFAAGSEHLHVWIGASYHGHCDLNAALAEVLELARKAGARFIRFGSHRRGWDRVAPRLGFVRDGDYFLMEVPDVEP